MQIIEFNSWDALAELREPWNALVPRSPQPSFFSSPDWLETHWRFVGANRKLRVLGAFDGRELVGVLPLNVQPEPTRLGVLPALTFPVDGWSSFYGPVGPRPAEVLAAGLEHVRRTPRDHDLLDLRGLPMCDAAAIGAWQDVMVIDLDQPWDAYWESRRRDHNRRRNVERCERRLSEQGTISYVRHRPRGTAHGETDPRWDLYDLCEQLAGKSWQSGLTDGSNTLSHAHVREFLRAAHVAAVNAGAADVNVLYLNDRPLAFAYGYFCGGTVDVMRIGFDPEWAKLAPGNALWTRMIQDSRQRGDRLLDLGSTCQDYKRFWMTRAVPSGRIVQYPATPRGQTLRFLRWCRSRFAPVDVPTNAAAKAEVARHQSARDEMTVSG